MCVGTLAKRKGLEEWTDFSGKIKLSGAGHTTAGRSLTVGDRERAKLVPYVLIGGLDLDPNWKINNNYTYW